MSTREQIIHNLRLSLHSFGNVIDALAPEQWNAQSLCPAWTTHGVVVHTTSIEAALLGWRPDSGENPFVAMGRIGEALSGLSPDDLRARYHEVVAARLLEMEAMTDEEFNQPSFTPVGQATYARFMAIRVFDIWVHERDIRVPLGIAGDDAGPAAEMALDEVEGSIGYIAGKKIGVADGQGLAFHLTGPVRRDIFVKVDGRAARVPELVNPDAVLTADSLTFVLLACGRINPDEPIRDGRVTWGGDAALGERTARNLAFTM